MNWVPIFLAAIQILANEAPDVIAQFHGGAHDTASKVGSALGLVNAVTTNLAAGLHPMDGVLAQDVHPSIMQKAAAIEASSLDPTGAQP